MKGRNPRNWEVSPTSWPHPLFLLDDVQLDRDAGVLV
jgi:hypothetical protein